MVVACPRPSVSSHAVIAAFALGVSRPSREIPELADAIATPTPVNASIQFDASLEVTPFSLSHFSSGSTTGVIARSNSRANAKSRSSCAGTAMIAPVP
ncbi:unannotated protein [freshwater metagenome]|uniref:Unannotated protein n=1 Tax=freshwater metagenome TaxID=449393 RepID=A0A6J7PTZ1_9ZZZZ